MATDTDSRPESISLFDRAHRDARALVGTGAPVYLGVNPVEYHGPHLSLHNDRLLTNGMIPLVHARLAPEHPILRVDDLEMGVGPVPGPGTPAVSFRTLRAAVLTAARSPAGSSAATIHALRDRRDCSRLSFSAPARYEAGMTRALFAWLGHTDLRAAAGDGASGGGPIAAALAARDFKHVVLLSDQPKAANRRYARWLRARREAKVTVHEAKLAGPTHFGDLYENATRVVSDFVGEHGTEAVLTFHTSPGTPQMAAVWVILAKTRFKAELIQSSAEHGVTTSSVPFDISAEYLPDLLREPDEALARLTQALPPAAAEFAAIVHRCDAMKRLVARARVAAVRDLPVLLLGETGTGKELFARAIHHNSPRRRGEFVAVNCGAIPSELIDSELFGHKRGAFTGATADRIGSIETASGGTLFLDEIGELPLPHQVRLLRVLQEQEIVRIGEGKPRPVDVRVVAATHRDLADDVAGGRFREDLFYRLAVLVLRIPPVRERAGDLGLLIDHLLAEINDAMTDQPGYRHKKLSAGARSVLLQPTWPGNVPSRAVRAKSRSTALRSSASTYAFSSRSIARRSCCNSPMRRSVTSPSFSRKLST